ncbi:MAG: hypothetical protein HY268_33835 [Deltaproteobacteria bacterium]|nr:hypothetical protein [Deltaproteobacteria bacterium]
MADTQGKTEESSAVDFGQVFQAELNHLNERRKATKRPEFDKLGPSPSTTYDLRGLALSGGGIRSATFNLGLLQRLGEHDDGLKWCDYLSTVSGGGYIGSCLTSLTRDNGTHQSPFPFLGEGSDGGGSIVKHLRLRCNYLAPRQKVGGIIDWLHLASHYLQGLLFSFVVITTLIALIATLSFLIFTNAFTWLAGVVGGSEISTAANTEPLGWFLRLALSLAVAWLVVSFIFTFRDDFSLKTRTFSGSVQGLLLGLSVLFLIIGLFFLVREKAPSFSLQDFLSALWENFNLFLLVAVLTTLPVLAKLNPLGGTGGRAANFMFYLLGIGTFLTLSFFVWRFIWLDRQHLGLHTVGGLFVILILFWVGTSLKNISMFSFYRDRLSEAFILGWTDRSSSPQRMLQHLQATFFRTPQQLPPYTNETLPLSDAKSFLAPLHLINATVNLPSSKNPALQNRRSDFFLLSPLHCGSASTKWRGTSAFESNSLTLADAMAISGAAVNPQSGPSTHRGLVFLLSLLNARLGVWVRNPGFPSLRLSNFFFRQIIQCWPWYFIKELLGRGTERDRLVSLSDGGHIENLGVYELLRRRCKVIVCSDAGEDPGFEFEDLKRLIQYAKTEQIRIDVNFTPLKADVITGRSQRHVVVGEISYPPGGQIDKGTLIYTKLTLIESDPRQLTEYKETNKAFPHDSTKDQFFDKERFKSYRTLGYCAGEQVVKLLSAYVK